MAKIPDINLYLVKWDFSFLITEKKLIEYAIGELNEIIEDDIEDGYLDGNELLNLKIKNVKQAIKFLEEYRGMKIEPLGTMQQLEFSTIELD